MKLIKTIHTHSVYLSDLIIEINKLNNINISKNREIIVNDILCFIVDDIIKATLDIPDDITIANIVDIIKNTIDTINLSLHELELIVKYMNLIRNELIEVVILECITPNTTIYTNYMINELITINLYDIHPIKGIVDDKYREVTT